MSHIARHDVQAHVASSPQVQLACYVWMEKELRCSQEKNVTTIFDNLQTNANVTLVKESYGLYTSQHSVKRPANGNCLSNF